MNHIDHPVTLYAGPLDGLVMPAAELEELVREYAATASSSLLLRSERPHQSRRPMGLRRPGLLDKKR